jgi:hypothetical protein
MEDSDMQYFTYDGEEDGSIVEKGTQAAVNDERLGYSRWKTQNGEQVHAGRNGDRIQTLAKA